MRVLFVTRGLAPDDASEHGRLAACTLADLRRRHRVDVVAGYVRGRRLIPGEALGVDLCGRGPLQAAWALRRAVWRRARTFGPDVVVTTSVEAPRSGRPAVAVLTQAPDPTESWSQRAALARLTAFQAVLVPDGSVADALVEHGVDPELVQVCVPGVTAIERRRSPGAELRIAGLGPIGPEHGQHVLIDAVARLAPVEKARVHLDIAGHVEDPVYLGHLRVQAHDQSVRLLPDPDPGTRRDLIARADLVAHVPVRPQAWPLDAITAAISGVPVVISDHPRLRSLLSPAAYAVPPSDVPALRDRLRALLDDAPALGAHARAHAAELAAHLGRDATSERLAELLDQAVR